jgi:hypothetical protein
VLVSLGGSGVTGGEIDEESQARSLLVSEFARARAEVIE